MDHIDDNIFQNAKSGNEPAFERLVAHYGALGYNIAYRMTGNRDDARDVSQEAWIKVYKNLPRCKNAQMFRPWYCTIVNNACIDFLRRRSSRAKTTSLDEMYTYDDGDAREINIADANSPNPEETALKNEQYRELYAALNKLTPPHKQMIIYRDINGFSYEEIAGITRQNLGTVKSQIARAREALRKTLYKD